MKILSWNARGLGRKDKRGKFLKLVRDRKLDMLMLQETKKTNVDEIFVKSMWPIHSLQFLAVDSVGNAGGLLCVWNPTVFKILECCSTRNFLLLSGIFKQSFECVIVNIYAPNDERSRGRLWELLVRLKSSFHKPWCIRGNFNEIHFLNKRRGFLRRDKGMIEFNEFIELIKLVDLSLIGRDFTWCNSFEGDRWSRIDRFLLDPLWLEKFSLKQWGLPRNISDHCPLVLMEDKRDWGPRPFRFLNAWSLHPNFMSFAKKSWSEAETFGWAGFRLKNKFASLKMALKKWNVEVFRNVEPQLKSVEEELHEIDLKAENGSLLDTKKGLELNGLKMGIKI
ncbi:uncharacterized protein LOC114274386 [Camellia sinensis]|uniref:uncharacterized protein LOC114274386 n=1 Tax=Camellia sinensis TaxID=4442 RepID=UPI001036C3B1|nr:uncharacterized protein LOC114274386 [Camellia sinensis]